MAQRKFIIDGGFQVNDDSIIEANLEMAGHILPTVDSDGTTGFDLGSTTAKWRDLFLSEGSLYINNQKVIEDNSGTIVVRADEDQSLTVKTEGTGVLTLQSATTVNFAGNLQMASGTAISSNDSTVTFSDKIDMDNNQIINVALPTADGHAATKKYVDDALGGLINGAPAALDTLNELANALGDDANFASTVATDIASINTIQTAHAASIATLNTDVASNAADIVTLNTTVSSLSASSSTASTDIAALQTSVATNAADISANSTAVVNAIATAAADATAKANAAQAAAEATSSASIAALDFNNVSGGIAVTGGNLSVGANSDFELSSTSEAAFNGNTIVGEDPDLAGSPALCASSFRPTTGGSNLNLRSANGGAIDLDGGDVTYGGTGIVGDDPDNAGSPTVCASTFRPVSGQADLNVRAGSGGAVTFGDAVLEGVGTPSAGTDATNKSYVDTYADAAEAAAVATAAADATTKANAAQAAAEATAAADATAKANAAQAAAIASCESYADTAVSNLVNGASSAFDTLKEIQDAMATDAELSAAISGLTIGNGYVTMSAGDGLTGGGSFSMNQTNNETITMNVGGGNGITVSADGVAMSGSYTGTFTASGDICAYSDASLKTNIETIEGALGRVEAIRGVTFERIEDGSTSVGVVAQELEAVLPEAVHTDANGTKMVAYGNVTGLLIEAVKELSAQVAELKK